MKYILLLTGFIIILFIAGCDKEVTSSQDDDNEPTPDWLIPSDEVFDGGPGRDGIPALVFPEIVNQSEITYLDDDDLIVAIRVGDTVRGYPHPILDWHEIINDSLEGVSFAMTYCPLTGSALAWDRTIDNRTTTFGVSGLLYNTNLIPYDRATGSNWSQMRIECVNGDLIGEKPELLPVLETSWATFKLLFPNAGVVTKNTGHARSYNTYPYGDYRTNNDNMLFPVEFNDSRMPAKWRVLGVRTAHGSRTYPIEVFLIGTTVLNETYDGTNIVAAGSKSQNLIIAYDRKLSDGTILTFSHVADELPIILKDNEGTKWDVFGRAISGPRAGEQLKSLTSHIAYWFAWLAFNPGAATHPY